ncbi:MAG TPA: NAD(P)-dependent oxidoreductase, partial [Ktedonobacteraceae bacterium]|nr:NAD(P)-dependent oxidoreductase [Ktedonobacteraceae bacterium]
MNILLTGATGNLGKNTLPELLRQGHRVRCFVRRPRVLERIASRSGGRIEVVQGDMRQPSDLTRAVQDVDVIIHLAYMIPPDSEDHPELARSINVDGTRYLLEAASRQSRPPRILFSSSLDVFGHTQDQPPPRKVTDPVQATDHYTAHKIACEEMVRTSGLQWAIFRFADVPPLGLRSPHPIMFKIPLATRFEVIHPYDAGLAIANGICSQEVWGKTLLIGGGPGCQILYRDYLGRMLEMMGVGMLPERAFGIEPYSTDWLDTTESQRLLHYQRYTFDDIMQQLTRIVGYKRVLTRLARPLARWWILRLSPYYR